MSARGARSRKVQQKDIEKKEKKIARTGKAPVPSQEEQDAFAAWRLTPSTEPSRNALTRSLTVSSNNSRTTSHSGSAQDGVGRSRLNPASSNGSSDVRGGYGRSSGGGTTPISDGSSLQGKEKTVFKANGKDTKAPRGRGGGVPTKKPITLPPAGSNPHEEHDFYIPADQRTWKNFKVWNGAKGDMRPYNGFVHDEDMSEGSVLIYFKEEQKDEDCPTPSIRARLDVLQRSGSMWIQNALAYGQIDDEDDMDDWAVSNDLELQKFSQPFSPQLDPTGRGRLLGPISPRGQSPPPFDIDGTIPSTSSRAGSRLNHATMTDYTNRSHSPPPARDNRRRDPTHEIWFTAPSSIQTLQGQRLHHVAIRNFLAMLHGKPIIGANLAEMLITLQSAIQIMYDLDGGNHSQQSAQARSVTMITNYLGQHGLDDVRNNIKNALSVLSWSEQEKTKWRAGYLESFVHLTGLMSPQIEEMADFKRLSIITRRSLSLAGKSLRLDVMEAEGKLATFDFKELWGDNPKTSGSPIHQGYETFRDFLVAHYRRIHGSWPPASNKSWLDRRMVRTLQEDFGALYDYIVDRDVVWNPREERASRKWEMAHRQNDTFKADLPELNITDMLVTFDARYGYAHIPHPYPLLPREVPKIGKEKEKKSFFSSLKKEKTKDMTQDAKAHLQLSIVFSDATNIEKSDVNFDGSTLIDKFEQFELTTDLKYISPREARLGRWLLLYGILQVLSTLSIDVQGLKYTEGVRYFLCPELKRLPEWVTSGQTEHLEASQQCSWCWQRAWDPTPIQTAPIELEAPSSFLTLDTDIPRAQQHASFPSPPPDRQLPAPPTPSSLDGNTLVQHDIRRIREKINEMSLSHSQPQSQSPTATTHSPSTAYLDHKLPIQGASPNYAPPRTDSLSLQHHSHHQHARRNPSHPHTQNDSTFRLTESDFHPHHHQQHPHHLRSKPTSLATTDLGSYPFSASDEAQWPVPPGYSESAVYDDRVGVRESTVLGSEGGMGNSGGGGGGGRGRELGLEWGLGAGGVVDDYRSPRWTHERRGWS